MHDELSKAFSLDGRVAVVTGAASGIGRDISRVLALAGATVVLADVNEGGLAETRSLVEAAGGTVRIHLCDVAERAAVDAVADGAVRLLGRLDIWVNCAGVIIHKPVLEVAEADLDFQVAVNFKGVYWGCAAAARAMKGSGGGSIVNISSSGADSPAPGISVYAMTKAAVNALTRVSATEFGPFGIRVNSIGPGFIYTPMTRAAKEPDPNRREAMLTAMAQASPLGISGAPRDIALAVLYLAADASRFVTGQVLRPNGGVTMV